MNTATASLSEITNFDSQPGQFPTSANVVSIRSRRGPSLIAGEHERVDAEVGGADNTLAFRDVSELNDKLAQEKLYLEEELRSEMNFDQIVGDSPALKPVLELVQTVAPRNSTVLLLGEPGTGKDLI